MSKIIFLLLIILSVQLVSGLGIVSDYNLNRPLEIAPGEKKEIGFRIQNINSEEDSRVQITIKSGKEIAQTQKNEVIVPGKSIKEIFINVEVPKEISNGASRTVTVSFKEVSQQNGEGISIDLSQDYSISVLVLGEPKEKKQIYIVLSLLAVFLILVVSIIILIVLIAREKKNNLENKQILNNESSSYNQW